MRLGQWKIEADWGHLAFATAMAVCTIVYVVDVISVSTHLNNTILVVPLSGLLISLYLILLARSISVNRADDLSGSEALGSANDAAEVGEEQSRLDLVKSMILLGALGVYAFTYEFIGLDVATFLFVAGALILLDVRRPLFIPLYAAAFTVVVIGGADWLLHYPMYTVILP